MTLRVRRIGGFHFGGREVRLEGLPVRQERFTVGGAPKPVDPNGDFEVEQGYAQYVLLEDPKRPCPMLLWHGGGMTGVTWEDTPDGRPGWQTRFLEAGWDTYVSDAVERGRAGWAQTPEVFRGQPVFREKASAWDLFRFGPPGSGAERRPHPDTLFPSDRFDQFFKQGVPRWTEHEDIICAAYAELLRKVGPAVIMAHSQGGAFALRTALDLPDLVRAVVLIEPSGAPDPADVDVATVREIPHLVVWGDHLEGHDNWMANVGVVRRYWDALAGLGGRADTLDLPALGHAGNSHFPMMDANSDAVAAMVDDWLTKALA